MLQVIVNVSLKKFQLQKRGTCYVKVILKKRRKESIVKMDKCPRYLKQWVLKCPPEKERDE